MDRQLWLWYALCIFTCICITDVSMPDCEGTCPKGTHPQDKCIGGVVTCQDCEKGTYSQGLTVFGESCRTKTVCSSDHMIVKSDGGLTSNRVCGCEPGYTHSVRVSKCLKDKPNETEVVTTSSHDQDVRNNNNVDITSTTIPPPIDMAQGNSVYIIIAVVFALALCVLVGVGIRFYKLRKKRDNREIGPIDGSQEESQALNPSEENGSIDGSQKERLALNPSEELPDEKELDKLFNDCSKILRKIVMNETFMMELSSSNVITDSNRETIDSKETNDKKVYELTKNILPKRSYSDKLLFLKVLTMPEINQKHLLEDMGFSPARIKLIESYERPNGEKSN